MINYIKLINFDIYLFLNFIRFKILNIELLIVTIFVIWIIIKKIY
jgi:hypothetical protein